MFGSVDPAALEWETRPHEPGEPARHVAELSEALGTAHTRCNLWRYEPGAVGKRHVHAEQEETFVVLAGTLSIYVGEPPERRDVPTGGVAHVGAGTPLQSANHGEVDLLVFVTGSPPDMGAEVLDSAV
jgi:mannose-6-phosphate isomerase-like protein (cupin superfamily)